jgi:hypothetical protein
VTFHGALIHALNISTGHILCLAANSSVSLVNSDLVGNAAAMMHVQDATLRIINSTIKDNTCSQPSQGKTGVTVEGTTSRLHIEGSSFVSNSHALLEAPALHISGRANATVTSTTFSNNRVECLACGAGAIIISEEATGV